MHGLSGAGGPTTSFPTARVMYRTVLAPPPVVKRPLIGLPGHIFTVTHDHPGLASGQYRLSS